MDLVPPPGHWVIDPISAVVPVIVFVGVVLMKVLFSVRQERVINVLS